MKKLFIYSLLLLFGSIIKAQHTGFYTGANAAIQYTWILCSTDFDEKDKTGLLDFEATFKEAFGFDFGYKFSPKMGIQSGFIYSQQGQRYITPGVPDAKFKTDLSYFKIPLLFCYYIRPDKKISFILQAGYQFSFLSEAKSSREYTVSNPFGFYHGYKPIEDVKFLYSSSPIEFVAGFGLQFTVRKMCINLLFRGDYSITDIEKAAYKKNLRGPTSNFTIGLPQLGFQYYFK